jgi:[ribosomal protein S5]-alanine N-acetyltransferase
LNPSAIEFPIATERLQLRPFATGDVDAILSVYGDPEVMRYVGEGTAADRPSTERMIREYIAHQEQHGFSFWAVVERESGRVIGDAGLYHGESGGSEVEIGYTLGRSWWGRGYATEAASSCLATAFDVLALESVTAIADPANPASARVLDKLGMQLIGRRIAYGRPHLLYQYARTRAMRS